MKKYLFGLFAIIIAVGAVAFKTPAKFSTANFQFTGDATVQSQVEDPANWVRLTGSLSCTGGDQKACKITAIDEAYYDANFILNKTATFPEQVMTIGATSFVGGSSTTYYVSSNASGSRDNKDQ